METEALRLLHLSELHRLELQASNAELLRMKELAELESAKYFELFDSSPSGSLTLSRNDEILELNAAGAQMLGKERKNLKNCKFSFFVSSETRPIFDFFVKRIFSSHAKESCKVVLKINEDLLIDVILCGIAKANGEFCFITIAKIPENTIPSHLSTANQELFDQNDEKAKRPSELIIANKEFLFQNNESEKPADELVIANEKLITENEHLISLGNATIIILDSKFCITRLNKAFQRLTGYSETDLIGQTLNIILSPVQEEFDLEQFQNTLRNGLNDFSEIRILHSDTSVLTLMLNSWTIFDSDGLTPISYLLKGNDISKRKAVEFELKERNKELQTLYYLSQLSERSDTILTDVFQKLANYLPTGWQYSDIACSRIIVEGQEFRSENFRDSLWKQTVPIRLNEIVVGQIEVAYLKEMPDADEGPFLNEERSLINTLAEQLQLIILRRMNEINLQDYSSRLSVVMKAGNMAWWEMNIITGEVVFDNRKAEMLGYPPEKFNHFRDFTDLLHPDDYEKVMDAMRKHYQGEKNTYEVEYRILTQSGEYKWCYDIGSIIEYDSKRQPLKVSGIVIDICDRKKKEDALKESEQRYHALVEWSPYAVLVHRDMKILYVNPAAVNLFGATSEDELVGTPVMRWHHPDYHQIVQERIRKAKEEGLDAPMIESKYFKVDGTVMELEVQGKPIIYDGLPSILATFNDVTERNRIEKIKHDSEEVNTRQEVLIKSLLESISEIIFYKDLEGIYLGCNSSFEEFLGLSRDKIIGKTDYELFDREMADWFRHHDQEMLKCNITTSNEEWVTYPNGKKILLDTFKTPYRDFDGTLIGIIGISRDITARKAADKLLFESEQRLQMVMEASQEGIWDFNVVSGIVTHNKQWFNLLGYHPGEIDDDIEVFGAQIHPDDREAVFERIEAMMQGKTDRYFSEHRLIGKNGTIWVNDRGTVIEWDEQGNPFRAVGSFTDITQRKNVEEELRKSLKRFDLLERYTRVFHWEIDISGLYTYISNPVTDILGFEPTEIIGEKHFYDLHPKEGREAFKTAAMEVMKVKEDFRVLENEIETKDGRVILVSTNGIPIVDDNGNLTGYRGSDTDITSHKKAEKDFKNVSARLSLAARAGGVGIWDYDLVNNTVLWDDQMMILYGISVENFGEAYETWLGTLHPEDKAKGEAEIRKAIEGEKEFDSEFRVIWPDGSVHNIKALAIVQRDQTGKPLHMIGTNWDITLQKQNEEILLKARQEAEFANKAKSEFLANMSHEIRTPLNSIIGFSQLMNRQNLTNTQMEYSKSIHRSGEHLLILLNDILELSKIEAGHAQLNRTNIDLTVLFRDLQLMFNQQAQSKQLELIFEWADEFSKHVFADETKIRRILINLIGNAIKFTETGSVVVRVRINQTEEQKNSLVVEVQDSGPGIPESDFERIFKHFEQTNSGIKQGVGTGLGLALSHELAALMGGNISVASEIGKGSVFTFRVVVEEGKPEFAEEKINQRVIGIINPHHAYRILVVDDKRENLDVIVNFLQLVGFETFEAVSGEDAIAKFEQWNPHLILMDLRMPVMDGYEATRRIKLTKRGKRTPVIALTASPFEGDKVNPTEHDFQGYIQKPFREDELFGVIGKILGITYCYEEEKEAAPLSRYLNNPEALAEDVAKLQANIVEQMQRALYAADFYLMIEHTRKIDATNPELAQYLRALANNFDLDNLMEIINN